MEVQIAKIEEMLEKEADTVYRLSLIHILTKNEFKILQVLMEHAGKIVTREELMTALWESDAFVDDNTLTVNVTRLRRKLAELAAVEFIKTKKGIGYIIET